MFTCMYVYMHIYVCVYVCVLFVRESRTVEIFKLVIANK